MKTSRQNFAQIKTRYGRTISINENKNNNKMSQSFFHNPVVKQRQSKFNTISNTSRIESTNTESMSINITDDEKIKLLISKNDRLRQEIRKIQRVLETSDGEKEKVKQQYGLKLPEIRIQVADKQLENAYKMIKHYEHEIQKLKSLESQGTYAVRLTKAQRALKQKQQLRDKLKIQLQKIQKSSKNITKNLMDDRKKIILQNKSKKLNDQLKMYQKKWSQNERKKNFFMQSQKKKRQYIIQLQKKLHQSGVMKTQIQQLKRKIYQAETYRKDQSDDQKQQVQDRTPQMYQALVSELKLLKKVTITNQKLYEKLQQQKDEFHEKNKKLKIKIDQADKETQIIENEINFLKKHIDPEKIKPKIPAQGSYNSRLTMGSLSMSQDSMMTDPFANRSLEVLQHHFEFVQIGQVTKRSDKFNDRKLLGKMSAKLIGVEVYQNRMQLLGFQFTYQLKQGQKIKGQLMKIKNDNQRFLNRKQLYLDENDYFATIQCFMNEKKIIVGVMMISKSGQTIKAGNMEGSKRFLEMNPREYPACVYAGIVKQGIQLIGVEKVEPQSF